MKKQFDELKEGFKESSTHRFSRWAITFSLTMSFSILCYGVYTASVVGWTDHVRAHVRLIGIQTLILAVYKYFQLPK